MQGRPGSFQDLLGSELAGVDFEKLGMLGEFAAQVVFHGQELIGTGEDPMVGAVMGTLATAPLTHFQRSGKIKNSRKIHSGNSIPGKRNTLATVEGLGAQPTAILNVHTGTIWLIMAHIPEVGGQKEGRGFVRMAPRLVGDALGNFANGIVRAQRVVAGPDGNSLVLIAFREGLSERGLAGEIHSFYQNTLAHFFILGAGKGHDCVLAHNLC